MKKTIKLLEMILSIIFVTECSKSSDNAYIVISNGDIVSNVEITKGCYT